MSEIIQKLPQKKLSILPTFREAFGFAWGQRRVFWGWILVGALLAGLVDFVNLFDYGEKNGGITGLLCFAIILLTPIPSLLVFALLAVYCHRTFLLNHVGESRKIRFFFTERERKFFVWIFFGLPFCVFVSILPVILVVGFIWYQIGEMFHDDFWENTFVMGLFLYVGVLFPFYYIFGRWILVLPAIAIDQEPRLGWSWK